MAVRSAGRGAHRSPTASTTLAPQVTDQAAGELAEPLIPGFPYLRAQVLQAVDQEMAITLCDCLIRRLHVIHEVPDQRLGVAGDVARLMAPHLDWTEPDVQDQVASYRAAVALTRRYRDDSPARVYPTPSVLSTISSAQ